MRRAVTPAAQPDHVERTIVVEVMRVDPARWECAVTLLARGRLLDPAVTERVPQIPACAPPIPMTLLGSVRGCHCFNPVGRVILLDLRDALVALRAIGGSALCAMLFDMGRPPLPVTLATHRSQGSIRRRAGTPLGVYCLAVRGV
jgi:hypothetical protein